MKLHHVAIASLALLLGSASASAGSRIFVNSHASGANDGTSWDDAFTDLHDGLAAATAGMEVWVAGGPYVPSRALDGTPSTGPDATFRLPGDGVRVYGGFLGGEDSLDQRNPIAHRTVLDGQTTKLHVVSAQDLDGTNLFDGFEITGGFATGVAGSGDVVGGGMTCVNARPTVANCRFISNFAQESGGGLNIVGGDGMWVVNCRFEENMVGVEGAGGGLAGGVKVRIAGCLFANNIAQGAGTGGGASIGAADSDAPIVSFCTFVGNEVLGSPGIGGGLAVRGEAEITNSIFASNSASSGPQIHTSGKASVLVQFCNIEGGGFPGPGNIDQPPLFANESGGNFRLQEASASTDSGSLAFMPPDPADLDHDGDPNEFMPLDIDLTPRVFDDVPNMGSFEAFDCNLNDQADFTDIVVGVSGDCNGNVRPDECDISSCDGDPACADCNQNIIPDGCESDCNGNGVVDDCDVDPNDPDENGDVSLDCNFNIVPDECEGISHRLFVNELAEGANTGDSWDNAYTRLWKALCIAAQRTEEGPVEIWVAQGTYSPAEPFGSIFASFEMRSHVEIYGGFGGFETERGQRNIAQFPTILSGDLNRNDDNPKDPNSNDNSLHVLAAVETDSSAVLDGFTIAAGQARDFKSSFDRNGGGMVVSGASPTIRNCTFAGNIALGSGGAAWIEGSDLTLTNCTFQANLSLDAGGGLAVGLGSNVTLTNCVFIGNSTLGEQSGGALFVSQEAAVTLTNCTITANSALLFPGGVLVLNASLQALNSILWGNAPGDLGQFGSSVSITFSDVGGGFAGAGNIDADPRFVQGEGSSGLLLGAGSPCIDAGDNDANLPDTDALGGLRIQQCRVDMGALESPLFADCDANGLGDACEIQAAPGLDCDSSLKLDRCEISAGLMSDCDENGIPDACDLDSADPDGNGATASDCNENAVPDGCEADADGDGVLDLCDNCPNAANAEQADGDEDSLGDACDILQLGPCPENIDITPMDEAGVEVTFELPTAVNGFGSNQVVASPPSGSLFVIGTTTVTVTATDEAGNIDTCMFDVLIREPKDMTSQDDCPPLYRLNSGALSFFGIPIGCGPGCLVAMPLVAAGLVGMKTRIRLTRSRRQ